MKKSSLLMVVILVLIASVVWCGEKENISPLNSKLFIIISWIISLLGGGVLGAIINWMRAERAEKKDRRIRLIDDQIRKLYGPLYYFVSQSEELFKLNDKFHEAYRNENVEKGYETKDYISKLLTPDDKITLDIANDYIKIVENNNQKIKEILDNNYSLIDHDDIESFLIFFKDYIRLITERDDEGRIKTPFPVYKHVGDISFLRPNFINKVRDKFLEKKNKLDDLLK